MSETIAEIVECMRGRGEDTRMDAALWRRYADRIEAAWKREKAEIEAGATSKMLDGATIIDNRSCGNAAEIRKALESARNWCLNRLGNASYQVDVEWLLSVVNAALAAPAPTTDKSSVVGDAAAMRDALAEIRDCIKEHPCQLDEDSVFEIVTKALAAPARNCDMFATVKEAAIEFSKLRNNPHPCPDFVFSEWLFAPAAERTRESREQE